MYWDKYRTAKREWRKSLKHFILFYVWPLYFETFYFNMIDSKNIVQNVTKEFK